MMLRNAAIRLNHADGIYKPGDVVSGSVKFQLSDVMVVECFYVELCGEAKTSFTLGIIYCSGAENYIKQSIVWVSRQDAEEKKRWEPGAHIFYFSFKLPEEVPDSMIGEWGKISYTLQFCTSRTWSLLNKKCVLITVKNTRAQEEQSPQHLFLPFFHNFWFRGGQILGSIKIESARHKVGSEIPIIVHIDNRSRKQVVLILSKLVRKTTYTVSSPVASLRNANMTLGNFAEKFKVQAGEHRVYSVNIPILANYALSDVSACTIIKMVHVVEINLRIRGFRHKIRKQIPVELYTE